MADFASSTSSFPSLTCLVGFNEALKSEASTCPADRSRCCSCAVVFGDWQPRELESLLNRPSCSCIMDASANLRLIRELDRRDLGYSEAAEEADTDSDDQDPQCSMSYQEWISRRLPIKLPPGLPRPPRQPAPADEPCTAGTSYDDEDLDDDCDEWYNRNVAAGNFPDWMRQGQPHASEPLLSSAAAAGTTAAAVASQPPATASTTVGRILDEDLDAECDEWFKRNVASGLFSSWLTTEAVGAQSATPEDPRVALKPAEDGVRPAPIAMAEELSSGAPKALQQGPAAAHGGLQLLAVGSADNYEGDGDGSSPTSPTGSDCRAASDSCYSQVSSRSCSSLSLGSLDGECGASSGSEEDEEVGSADAASEKKAEEMDGERLAGVGCRGCAAEPSARELGLVASALEGAAGAMLRIVDCGGWEAEVEVEARAREAVSGDCGGAARGYVEQLLEGSAGLLCGPYDTWLEAQLAVLVGDVVTGALF